MVIIKSRFFDAAGRRPGPTSGGIFVRNGRPSGAVNANGYLVVYTRPYIIRNISHVINRDTRPDDDHDDHDERDGYPDVPNADRGGAAVHRSSRS